MKSLYKKILLICFIIISCFLTAGTAAPELVERIVAVVNNDVILLSELREAMRQAEERGRDIEAEEIINDMINDQLLLKQAKKFSLGTNVGEAEDITSEMIIKNYVDKRIRALIYIPFRDVEMYYYNNIEKFGEKDFYDVKPEIEKDLLERMIEKKLRLHIEELRDNARIRIQLDNK